MDYLKPSFLTLNREWQQLLHTNCWEELMQIDKQLTSLSPDIQIYPPQNQIFNALSLTSLENIKVVILGQDPYHGKGEANGLAFSVNKGIKMPPSLRNIFKELNLEYGCQEKLAGEKLFDWAHQGVLLLNSTLTVIQDKANSLAHIGWQAVTDKIIQRISDQGENIVFMLWGNFAIKKSVLINSSKHLLLTTTHPSPLSAHRGFLGCNHFKLANEYLLKNKSTPVNWCE